MMMNKLSIIDGHSKVAEEFSYFFENAVNTERSNIVLGNTTGSCY